MFSDAFFMAFVTDNTDVDFKKGAIKFLEICIQKGIKLGIATSNSRELVDATMEALGAKQYFDCIMTSCEVDKGKPAPDIYLAVAKKLGVQPDECLVFEDIEMGILAGKNAGMEVCAIEDDFSMNQIEIKKKLADYYIKDYTDHETLKSIVEAVRSLNGTTLNEGTIAYTVNLAKLMLNNETLNNLLSYQDRGVTNKEVVADIDTLLLDSELLIDAGFVDMLFGTDINIVLPEVYEQIIRDVFDLNILEGQYANIIKFVATMFGLDTSIIDTSKLDQAKDKETIVSLMKDTMKLLENNGFGTITSFNKILEILTLQVSFMDYLTNENIKSVLDIVKDGISLTLAEAVLPTLVNKLTSTYLIQELRPLVVFDDNYTYADLVNDYNNCVYPMLTDLVDFGLVGIIKYDDVIDFDTAFDDFTVSTEEKVYSFPMPENAFEISGAIHKKLREIEKNRTLKLDEEEKNYKSKKKKMIFIFKSNYGDN